MIELDQISKRYRKRGQVTEVLQNVSLSVPKGEFLAITGPSGSGKTTLMNILGCLDRPTEGTYLLDGMLVNQLNGAAAAALRNRKIGFVFQNFQLISTMSALENVELPLLLRGIRPRQRKLLAAEALAQVGLSERTSHRPSELSGGQQQRTAIARVLAARPQLILADEPTGNLDHAAGQEILSILNRLHETGQTIVMITHDRDIAAAAQRVLRMENGQLTAI